MKILATLFLGVLIFLGGCSMAPKYTQPAAPVPSEWPQGEAYKVSSTPLERPAARELGWRDFFTDSRLQHVIQMALYNNRDLRLSVLNVERARALYGVQSAELLPTVDAVGTASKQRLASDSLRQGEPQTPEQYSLDLGIAAWEIDLFGRIRSLTEQALEEYLATDEARWGMQIALVSEVARTYLTLAADLETLKLARSTFKIQQAIYSIIQRQCDTGVATKLDLRRAQTQVEIARGDIARLMQVIAQDQNALNLLVGSPVPENLMPMDLADVNPTSEFFVGLSSTVLLTRPDIIAAEHRLKGAYAFIGAARAAFFPRISLTTTIGTASDEFSGLFGAGNGTWNFAPQVIMPIFDARTWAAYRVSNAERDVAIAEYEKTIQSAFKEVADALAVRGTIGERVSAQQALTNAAADTLRLSFQRYLKGIDSYLGVLDSQQTLYTAQQALISLHQLKLVNEVQLYAVLGGGSY